MYSTMGIPIDEPEYGDDCVLCWPAGLTPLKIFVDVLDMQQGALWAPGDPGPPNGKWELTQELLFPCIWSFVHADFILAVPRAVGNSMCNISFTVGPEVIFTDTQAQCETFFTNDLIVPAGKHYYGGTAQISYNVGGDGPDLLSLAELMGIPAGDDTFGTLRGIDTDDVNATVSSRRWNSNVLTLWTPP